MGKIFNKAITFKNNWIHNSSINCNYSVSVIIPVYKPEHLPEVLEHLSRIGGINEVILVDDNSNSCNYISNDYNFKLIIKEHTENLGRSAARNTGLAFATSEIVVFMDQDMLLAPDFIDKSKLLISANRNKGIALGFRTTKAFSEIPKDDKWVSPCDINDWRLSTKVRNDFVDLTASGNGKYNNDYFEKTINLVEMTNGFRNLGMSDDRIIAYWDLASMVISHSMAMYRDEIIKIGGFPEWIHGWGGEDLVVGFLAISNDCFIIPIDSISYHIEHKPFSGSESAKRQELIANISNYQKFAANIEEYPVFNYNLCRRRS